MKEKFKKLILILVGVIIRLVIVPFSSNKFEYISTLYPVSENLINGGLLYKNASWSYSPIFAFLCSIMNRISPFQSTIGNNIFLAIPIILADIGILLAIFHISKKVLGMSENKSLFVSALFFLNPRIISEVLIGHFDSISTLLVLVVILLILKSKDEESQNNKFYLQLISGIVLGIACLTRIYIVLLIPLLVLVVLKIENIRKAVVFLVTSLGTITLGILPFIILYPNEFFTNIASNELFIGFNQSSLWFILSKYLPTFNLDFISNNVLNIISYVATGIICSFVVASLLFKKEDLSKKKIIQIIGMYCIGFAAFYSTNLIQYYVLFIPLLLPVIFSKKIHDKKSGKFNKIMIIKIILLSMLSLADLGLVISKMEKIFPLKPGTENYLGIISVIIYFIACVMIFWLEILDFFESKELIKFTQFVIVGLSGTLITWGTLFAFVDRVGLPEWISYFFAYSLGIVNNFFWNRLWTFKDERKRVKLEFFKYTVANSIGLIGYWITSSVFTYAIGVHYFISNIFGTAVSFTINYLLTRFWTFNYQFYYKLTPVSQEKKPFSLILPMYNEEKIAKQSILTTVEFLRLHYDDFEVIVAEHGAEDKTPEISQMMAKEYQEVTHIHIDEVLGRGESLTNAIKKAKNNIVMFMDADLAVELDAILIGIGKVIAGVDLVYGDRYHPESKTERPLVREIISRVYNFYLRLIFRDKIADHQCGFKIFNRSAILPVLDQMKDFDWFWDSEILIRAKLAGLKLEPISVLWSEHRNFNESKVNIFRDIKEMGSAAINLKKTLKREKKLEKIKDQTI